MKHIKNRLNFYQSCFVDEKCCYDENRIHHVVYGAIIYYQAINNVIMRQILKCRDLQVNQTKSFDIQLKNKSSVNSKSAHTQLMASQPNCLYIHSI